MKIPLHHLAIAMLATAATISTASAHSPGVPRVNVSVPVNPGAAAAAAANAGRSATSSAINAGKDAISGAKGNRPRPQNRPKPVDMEVEPGGTGAGGGGAVEANAGSGGVGQAGIAGRIAAAGGGVIGAMNNPYTWSPKTAEDVVIMIFADVKAPNKSDPDDKSGSTPKVANAGPTSGTTPTATLPGPAGGTTTTTASHPGDPPDAKPPLSLAEHQKLVDTARNLNNAWKNLDNQYNKQEELISKARSGTLTPGEQKAFDDSGGIPGLEQRKQDTANQRDATYKQYEGAQKEAKKNDSYRYVR